MNKVLLVGRLTADPEIRYTQGEQSTAVARFTVAVDRRFKRENEQTADFPSCVAFGKTAEFLEKYFKKGQRIGLAGRLQTGSYTNKDGVKVYTTDIVAEEVEFVESKGSSEAAAPEEAPAPATDENGFMNIPDDIDEDLPFN